MRYIRNKYEVWSHNYEKKSGYYMVWERKYELIMMYICGIDVIFMRYKTRYLRVQMKGASSLVNMIYGECFSFRCGE